jgi:hypothetical protein
MKKILLGFCALICALSFTSCNTDVDHPIAGKVFVRYGGSSIGSTSVWIHFFANGEFSIDYMKKTYTGYEHNEYDHMEWTVEGNEIKVYHDNSTYWKSHVRGTLSYEGYYNSSNNTVILDGSEYEFAY